MLWLNQQTNIFGANSAQAFTTGDAFKAVGFSGGGLAIATKVAGSQIQARGFLLVGNDAGQNIASGAKITAVRGGKLRTDFTDLTPGNPLYLGTGGLLQKTAPTGGDYVQTVGFAINATDIMIEVAQIFTAS